MPINSDNIKYLCGGDYVLNLSHDIKRLAPFSDVICDFFSELSPEIMKNPESKSYPDVITFGFFCRKGNISKLKEEYADKICGRLGRGMTFHIAPSNVPINFAYSMAAALLAGNSCVVRASSKPFPQIDLVCCCINNVLQKEKFAEIKNYIAVIRYEHSNEITNNLSMLADVRVIWGGDNTIKEIRRSPLPSRSSEITFADRYSIAVINSESVNKCENMPQLARDFYNDTYLYDQNACSSPRLIYWLGNENETCLAQKKFWSAIHDFIVGIYEHEPVVAVNMYAAACRMAIDFGAKIITDEDNLISRISVDRLNKNFPDYRCAGGSFIEYRDDDLNALKSIITEKYQTLSYFGLDEQALADFVIANGLCGIDRIVPIGKTADFSLVWDGYDLIIQMSRAISY